MLQLTARGFGELVRLRLVAGRRPVRLRERLHPPRRRALRGPRRPVRGGPARRRGHRRPGPDRRHRAELRRRRVARAGDPQGSRDERRWVAVAVDEPARDPPVARRRGPGDPVERPRVLADAERPHARLRDRLADRRPVADRGREAVVRRARCTRSAAPPDTIAPPGLNSQADLTSWNGLLNAGEPYDSNPEAQTIVAQIAHYHSPYYLLDGAYGDIPEAPAPMLIANGFTDDLFPVDEAVRYYNLERAQFPSDPISLIDGDFGHMRAQNKAADLALLSGADPEPVRPLPEGHRERAERRHGDGARRARRAHRPGPPTPPPRGARCTPGRSTSARPPRRRSRRRPATPRSARRSIRSPARARARRCRPPIRAPASPPTGCRRPPARATRCSGPRP